ncbi:MAG: CoA-acylating methylmalonate-semialdehyde dehydrogenase [Candidatus Bathyarchaeota archaeon]|nr:CoA-acylating methylmalonate-semialdehyde dehydrogenase [Candidatus Bathyarchaeota archaeon]
MSIIEEPIKKVQMLKNYVNGEWIESEANVFRDVVNPATMKTIGKVPISNSGDLDEAVKAAREAFPEWRRTTPLTRARYFLRLKELLEENFEEVSRVGVMEHGKTIDESRGETRRGIENVECAAGIPSLMMGYNLEDIARGIDEYLIRQPLGVFACIAPFNFPFMVPLWYMPYAVATGNTYVVKPSPWTPFSQHKLFELIDEAGFPPGVINMVHGDVEVANAIIEHPDVKGVSFVGSTPVGRDIIYKGATAHGKRVQAQCGAKNFLVVMPDASVDRTIPSLMTSFYGNTGQRCLSGANLVIVGEDDAFYNRFLKKTVEAAANIRIGYGLDESVQMGPLQAEVRKTRVLGYIEKGVEEGAKLLLDGRSFKIVGNYPDNCFLGPSIFQDVTEDMVIAKEEIFGPVMNVIRTKNLDDAIKLINNSAYGNEAAIFTDSGRAARKFQYEVTCGNIGINIGVAAPMAFFPFSGMKDSFFGDLHGQGRDAVNFFTEQKVVIVRWF